MGNGFNLSSQLPKLPDLSFVFLLKKSFVDQHVREQSRAGAAVQRLGTVPRGVCELSKLLIRWELFLITSFFAGVLR